jgi:hypothetical protein
VPPASQLHEKRAAVIAHDHDAACEVLAEVPAGRPLISSGSAAISSYLRPSAKSVGWQCASIKPGRMVAARVPMNRSPRHLQPHLGGDTDSGNPAGLDADGASRDRIAQRREEAIRLEDQAAVRSVIGLCHLDESPTDSVCECMD